MFPVCSTRLHLGIGSQEGIAQGVLRIGLPFTLSQVRAESVDSHKIKKELTPGVR